MRRFVPGFELGDRYELLDFVAAGGMGDVWRALDRTLGREVAIKIMRPAADADPVFAQRFHEEALTTAGLSHHNIATLFDYGTFENLAYLVMEYVDGESLSALIRRQGALRHEKVRSIVGQMALALAAAHDAGVVHRDVKPANVLITIEGAVKLTDFGIARALNASGLTRTGETLGTPYYLSPEQALGRPATAASDIYALGVVAHELLTGKRPFDRDTPVATAIAHVTDPMPTLPATIPSDLVDIIGRCLAKEPAERPIDAREVARAAGMPSLESTAEPTAGAAAPGASLQTLAALPPAAKLADLLVRRGGRILVIGARSAAVANALSALGHDVVGLDGAQASIDVVTRSGEDAAPGTEAVTSDVDLQQPSEAGPPRPTWKLGLPDRVTNAMLDQSAGTDAILWLGDAIFELNGMQREDAFRALAGVSSRNGRLLVEFATTPDYTYPEFRDDFLAGGWVPDLGFSSWDLRPMTPDAKTTIVILSRR